MKIRTLQELQEKIDYELGWRKRELTTVKFLIKDRRRHAKDTALRSGIALLYAHWEGSIKNLATFYLSYVSNLRLNYNSLKTNFFAIHIKSQINNLKDTNKSTFQTEILNEIFSKYSQKSQIQHEGIIKSASNLNSHIFIEIMSTIGLDHSEYDSFFHLIDDSLLCMRNKVAHGDRLESLSLDEFRYSEIHEKIINLIEKFANQIFIAAQNKHYLS